MKHYRQITTGERVRFEALLEKNIVDGVANVIDEAVEWINTPEAVEFFTANNQRVSSFFRDSGIQQRWDSIIYARAAKGADIAEQIYNYARQINSVDVLQYTSRERAILNGVCDNQYELIVNVGQQEVASIRRCILEDLAAGANPRETRLKEIALEPINGWTPQQRAVVISRTETARCINAATLEQYRADGVEFVELMTTDPCPECEEISGSPVPIDAAEDIGVVHPNCRCRWVPVIPEIPATPLTEVSIE